MKTENLLLSKIRKNSSIKESDILSHSIFFNEKDMITTPIPAINVLLSGRIDGGITPGLTQWVGESRRFKSGFCLLMAKCYMEKYPDAVLLFYDSEFGTPISYFNKFNIDKDRVVHSPITDIEKLKFDIIKQLNNIERGEKLFIIVDSIGNLPSKKEVDDTLSESSSIDLTRQKQLKSLFRMVPPYLNIKNIPMHVVNHSYQTLSLYSQTVVSGGQGIYLSSDNIYIIGRQQDKDGTELSGYNFVINVEKSRYVKEKSKIPISITFEKGINKWSGLMDIALELNFCVKPVNGWYSKINIDTGEVEDKKYRLKDTDNIDFWDNIINNEKFKQAIYEKYSIVSDHHIITEESYD